MPRQTPPDAPPPLEEPALAPPPPVPARPPAPALPAAPGEPPLPPSLTLPPPLPAAAPAAPPSSSELAPACVGGNRAPPAAPPELVFPAWPPAPDNTLVGAPPLVVPASGSPLVLLPAPVSSSPGALLAPALPTTCASSAPNVSG